MVMDMTKKQNTYTLLIVALTAIAIVAIGIATAQVTERPVMPMNFGDEFPMGMGMMMHMDESDLEWMKGHMSEHMNLTEEEIDEMFEEMQEHCPMMRSLRK